ncbi:molybdopterin-dependent oxidoreductase [Marinobacter nauticus]|uniref:Oxidoreductase molybdopterin-binding domain-containing protein n=1 Tax=Marinobacter nauticus TaxID=2743 RepID=A0A368V5N0_MARNT|nr:molybdopterin-dependent oxidoreductase [Marinobacter nauticus]RBP75570.1 hypothetical protein DET64_103171 [Marinobacter nauticus]RCW36379.1 hypothetical protein DET51_103171 [Marinobacter nauticus]
MNDRLRSMLGLAILLLITCGSASAQTLEITDGKETLVLDRALLESFPQSVIETTSPYYDGTAEFSGPTLARVIEHFGSTGASAVTLVALNGYKVSGSMKELMSLDAIVSTRQNGEPMSIRQRGPYWIMLPLSERPELDSEDFHRYMVWQLNRIELTQE